jgi:hypothetical protein
MSTVRNDVSARVALQPERAVFGSRLRRKRPCGRRSKVSMSKRVEQSSGYEPDPGRDRVSVVTPQNRSAEAPASAAAAAPAPAADADGDVAGAAAEPSAATGQASQADLTQSVGTRLTREDHDAELPAWRRWLTTTFSR